MELEHLAARRFRSLREIDLSLSHLNVFIGANAAGKSNILDGLRFLVAGAQEKDFSGAVRERGGPLALAWKGEPASIVRIVTRYRDAELRYEWVVEVHTPGYGFGFSIAETVEKTDNDGVSTELLSSENGHGWWWSDDVERRVQLAQSPTACALAAAAANASFPARPILDYVMTWNFFDPNPSLLRRTTRSDDDSRLDPSGRNLATRLRTLRDTSPDRFEAIVAATRNVLGVPASIELRESEDGRVYFRQHEPGLEYPVHQVGTSSGTLRMLALMTGLLGESDAGLVGIEEPENYVHPAALGAFAEQLRDAKSRLQLLVTTHSPILLDHLDDPAAVLVVRRTEAGTTVTREENPQAVRKALDESGFALGEFHQTKGFGD
jgi:predicted ATPase